MTRAEITKRSYAADGLLATLLANGEVVSGDIKAAFASHGLSKSEARCARERLGVLCRWSGGMGVSKCYWYLPSNPAPKRRTPSPELMKPRPRRQARRTVSYGYVPEEVARMQEELKKKIAEVDSFLKMIEPMKNNLVLSRSTTAIVPTCSLDGSLDGERAFES